jgi:rhamnogalacturonyl hydrolase YesR
LTRNRHRCSGFAAALAVAAVGLAASTAAAANLPALPSSRQLAQDRATFLDVSQSGIRQTREVWANPKLGWYDAIPNGTTPQPLANLWFAFPLFEATAAAAIADPSPENKRAVDAMARQAENFWDPTIENGAGGFSWYYGLRGTGNAYFDDTGWWGIAYIDAYRATGNTRWLWDAGRALRFIDRFGWDARGGGGVWWNVAHEYKTAEPLAAGAMIAASLYRIQKKKYFLTIAKKYIDWADAKTLTKRGLYGRNATDSTEMDYVQGMMIAAHVQLCIATKTQSYCKKAQQVAAASVDAFPIPASWSPETDIVYMRGLLDLYRQDGDPRWYAVVHANAKAALQNSRDDKGFWSQRWDGGWGLPGLIYMQSATLQLFAWISGVVPPEV